MCLAFGVVPTTRKPGRLPLEGINCAQARLAPFYNVAISVRVYWIGTRDRDAGEQRFLYVRGSMPTVGVVAHSFDRPPITGIFGRWRIYLSVRILEMGRVTLLALKRTQRKECGNLFGRLGSGH